MCVSCFSVAVPVSKPTLWPVSSPLDKLSCWGEPVIVRCGCSEGSAVQYSWYQNSHHGLTLLNHSAELYLDCGTVGKESNYYCTATNGISTQDSENLSVQVLMPADSSCIYIINMQGENRLHVVFSTTVRRGACVHGVKQVFFFLRMISFPQLT